jgi:hypothetical protein
MTLSSIGVGSHSFPESAKATLEQTSFDLLNVIFPSAKGVRLLGVSLSSLGRADDMGDHRLLLSL